jgi:hypothetical protein
VACGCCAFLHIPVDSKSVRVSSFLGARATCFRDISSVTDKATGRYRSLDVINTRGKWVLRVTSAVLPDFGDLVYSLQEGIKKSRQPVELAKSQVMQ